MIIFTLKINLNVYFQPGLAIKVGMNDLSNIQLTNEIKQMFKNFADEGTPFIIVCSVYM